MKIQFQLTLVLIGLCLLFSPIQPLFASKVIQLGIKGGIGPATADYIIRGIDKGQDAELILITLDTPGGLDKSTRQMVESILGSSVPVVIYVTPDGARAASAGTILLYASTVAVMSPSSHLGAASPVSLMGGAGKNKEKDNRPSTMEKKVTQDALAYMRSLAQLRDRNATFAQKAILEASTMTANEALKAGVINLIAQNIPDLLKQLDGMTVKQDNQNIRLDTKKVEIERIDPDWRMDFLLMVTDPTVAYLLLLLGIYGIFFELMNPGMVVPGVIGGVAILIALYALHLLPINYAGVALICLGFAFIIAEAYTPSFGILGLGGTVAFIFGSIMLMDTAHQGFQIAKSVILAMAAVNLVIFITLFSMAFRSRQLGVVHGTTVLIGKEGRAISDIYQEGQAMISGEIWEAKAKRPIKKDQQIRVIAVNGLTLEVEEV